MAKTEEGQVWQPPEGAQKPEKADYWKPESDNGGSGKGETVVGIIKRFFETRNGTSFVMSPVVIHRADGKSQGYYEIAVGLNSWLSKVIYASKHVGSPMAIQYKGKKATPQGNMRVYDVFELPVSEWEKERVKHLAGIVNHDEATPKRSVVEVDPDLIEPDDLPF